MTSYDRTDTAARPDEYDLTQTKGGRLAQVVMGPRNDLRWPRKLHDIRTLRAGMLVLRGMFIEMNKKKMNLLYLLYKEFEYMIYIQLLV